MLSGFGAGVSVVGSTHFSHFEPLAGSIFVPTTVTGCARDAEIPRTTTIANITNLLISVYCYWLEINVAIFHWPHEHVKITVFVNKLSPGYIFFEFLHFSLIFSELEVEVLNHVKASALAHENTVSRINYHATQGG